MERMKMMKETLMNAVQSQLGNLTEADTKELGEAIDMIKDLCEAMYYNSITEAMEHGDKNGNSREVHYYTERYIPRNPWSDNYLGLDPYDNPTYYPEPNRMYYNGSRGNRGGQSAGGNDTREGSTRGYYERKFPLEMRDWREGRSPKQRRMYMESKEMHNDKNVQMKELEDYLQELSSDITEMINDASPEEKQLLKTKITNIASKIN